MHGHKNVTSIANLAFPQGQIQRGCGVVNTLPFSCMARGLWFTDPLRRN